MVSPTFRRWLHRQRRRNDPVGDLARDTAQDKCAARARTPAALLKHIQREHPAYHPAVPATIDRAAQEWKAEATETA